MRPADSRPQSRSANDAPAPAHARFRNNLRQEKFQTNQIKGNQRTEQAGRLQLGNQLIGQLALRVDLIRRIGHLLDEGQGERGGNGHVSSRRIC